MSSGTRKIVILSMLAAIVVMWAWVAVPNYMWWRQRAKLDFTRQAMRKVATALDDHALNDLGIAPNRMYWGPLSSEMLKKLNLPPDEFIDPYNHDAPESAWRTATYFRDDGASFTPRGGGYQFYSDGFKFWMIVGRGPDGILSLTPDAIEKGAAGASDFRAIDAAMAPYTFDPTNGDISGGDVWRAYDP